MPRNETAIDETKNTATICHHSTEPEAAVRNKPSRRSTPEPMAVINQVNRLEMKSPSSVNCIKAAMMQPHIKASSKTKASILPPKRGLKSTQKSTDENGTAILSTKLTIFRERKKRHVWQPQRFAANIPTQSNRRIPLCRPMTSWIASSFPKRRQLVSPTRSVGIGCAFLVIWSGVAVKG